MVTTTEKQSEGLSATAVYHVNVGDGGLNNIFCGGGLFFWATNYLIFSTPLNILIAGQITFDTKKSHSCKFSYEVGRCHEYHWVIPIRLLHITALLEFKTFFRLIRSKIQKSFFFLFLTEVKVNTKYLFTIKINKRVTTARVQPGNPN